MSTLRPSENQIISSGIQNNTERNNEDIISSANDSPQIISSSLSDEIILNGKKYYIDKQIARSGEAEIFLVNQNGSNSIFKYYYSQYKPKDEILNKLKGLEHPDIITLIDYGYYQDRFFEISEYAQGGTLQDIMPVTSIQKVKEIVEETIEALNYCHTHGIIHRDIKPENIFYRTADKKDIVIGDFGIASNVKEGEEFVRTSLARTSLYAAPELFTNIQGKTTIEKSVDYYALGMTLLHLWFGRNPFEDIDEFGIMRLKSEGRILFPDNIDADVAKLIKGLITVNPLDRWAYDEVKRWIKGEDVKVNYQTIQFEYKPYSFGLIDGEQIVVITPKDMAMYLEKYRDKGEGHLYRNTIAKWIEPVDAGLYNELMDIVEKNYQLDKHAGITKAIYILDRERPFKSFDNTKLRTQEEIGSYFEKYFNQYIQDLQNPNASFYIFLEARNYKEKADEYRSYFKNYNPELALNTLILTLQGTDKFIIDNYTIYQPEELLKVDDNTKTQIINQLSNLNSKLSLWISGFKNLQPTIDKWRVLKRFDDTTLRYALQKGFEFNGSVAYDKSEFLSLFKNNFSDFFSDKDTKINQSEANYWLNNYSDSSFSQFVIDYLKSENYSDDEFCEMLMYALSEYEEKGMNIYQVIEALLAQTKTKTSADNQLFDEVIQIHALNIENLWISNFQSKYINNLDSLLSYLSFAEKNISSYPDFFVQLTGNLDYSIEIGIRLDIEKIKDDENQIKPYRIDLAKAVGRLKKITPNLLYLKRFYNEEFLIKKKKQTIAEKNNQEKREKIDITNKIYGDILSQNQKKFKSDTKGNFNIKFWGNIAIAVFSIILLIIVLINVVTLETIFAVFFAALTIYVVWFKMFDGEDVPMLFILIPVGIAALVGYFIGKVIPFEIFSLVLICITTIFSILAFIFYSKRLKEINAIGLKQDEQEALKQSLREIDRFFAEKESYESFQETVRIHLLDVLQFEKEFSSNN